MSKIGLLGCGTVGTGVYEIINEKRGNFFSNDEISIKKVLVRDVTKKRNVSIPQEMFTQEIDDILNDQEITMVVAVMGGMEPEYTYIKQALQRKKHVVTANKEIIALHIKELLDLAKENGVHILFEASVGGGIPIIDSVVETLKINQINKIQGILNGTTNFIVSKMTYENMDFDEVLKIAQDMGFAEADPTADVDGFDISRKLTILSTLCFGTLVDDDEIYKRGLRSITADDIQMADRMGYVFKYLAEAQCADGMYSGSVAPVLTHKNSIIGNVNEEYNIVTINGNIIGQLSFMGKGAGKDATANAVVMDVIKIIKGGSDYSHLTFDRQLTCCGISNYEGEFYLRISISNPEQFDKVVDIISHNVPSVSLEYQRGKIFFKTELQRGEFMNQLYEKLKLIADDVFYARIVDNIL